MRIDEPLDRAMTAILTRARSGVYLCPPFDTYLSQALIRTGEYCPAEFETWRPYIPQDGIVVDAGANIGCHTLPFAHAVGPRGSVLAIEPQRRLYQMLCGTVELNGLWNVRPWLAALGKEPGFVHVPYLDYDSTSNFGALTLDGRHDDAPGERVPRATLDAILGDDCPVDFLKLDIEGAELDALLGAEEVVTRCRPVISAEADREEQVPGLLDWLTAHDYRAWWHKPPLGPLWPGVISINLFAIPREDTGLPDPVGYVEEVIS